MRNEKCEMRNEMDRRVERGVLSAESLGSSELEDEEREILSAELRERLLPAEEREREMATDGLKIRFVAGDQRCADAARGQGDQYIEGQFPKLVPLVVLPSPHNIQQLAGVDPMPFSGSNNLAPIYQIHHEPKFKPRPHATKQLMQYYSRAANHIGSLEKTKGKATGSEVLDIDRGVQDG